MARNYLALHTLHPLRPEKILGLQRRDIDFVSGTVTLSRNLFYTPDKGVYEDTTKNSEAKTFDLAPARVRMLHQLRIEQTPMSKWVFTQEGSWEPMHPKSPIRWMQKFAKAHGIQHLSP